MHGPRRSLSAIGRWSGRFAWLVIAFWILLAGGLNLAIPQLETTVATHSAPFLPTDLPGNDALRDMAHDFEVPESAAVGSIILSSDTPIDDADRAYYGRLVTKLHEDTDSVAFIMDTYGDPAIRAVGASPDGKAINLIVVAQGDVGSTRAKASTDAIRALIDDADPPAGLDVNFTGPSPTLADLFSSIDSSLLVITLVSIALITALLLAVYRSIAAAAVPLMTVGVSLAVARPVLSFLGDTQTLSVSNFTIALATAMVLGATTDYAIFLISGYHEARRRGESNRDAIGSSVGTVGGILIASALTIAAAGVSMVLTKTGIFTTAGPPIAIAVGVGLAVSLTLPAALMSILGRRGLLAPRRLDEARWRRTGARMIRYAVPATAASIAVLIALSAVLFTFRMSYDENTAQLRDTDSKIGYERAMEHWGVNEAAPEYVIIRADHDMRNTADMAALELMADGISRVDGIAYVRSLTRPDGKPIAESATGYQTAIIGDALTDGHRRIDAALPDLRRLAGGAAQLHDGAAEATDRLPELVDGTDQVVAMADGVLDGYESLQGIVDTLTDGRQDVPQALDHLQNSMRGLSTSLRSLTGSNDRLRSSMRSITDTFAPLRAATPSASCRADPVCMQARVLYRQLDRLTDGRIGSAVAAADDATRADPALARATALIGRLHTGLASVQKLVDDLDGRSPEEVRADLRRLTDGVRELQSGLGQLTDGLAQVKDGTEQMKALTTELNAGVERAASYLTSMSEHTTTGAGRGFYLPPEAMNDPRMKAGRSLLMSPDGRTARMLAVWRIDPYSGEALDTVEQLAPAAEAAARGTTLSDAEVATTGLSTLSAQAREQVKRDFAVFGVVALVMVAAILIVLLRSLVAPLILVATVVLSFCAAAGLSTLIWKFGVGVDLDWSVLPVSFMALVAVGADYSMLFAARIKEESRDGLVRGVIRAFGSTGSVITTAGVVFAITMFALMSGSTLNLLQIGSTIGIGLLLDITVVRTVLVPASVAILGDRFWWPAKPPTVKLPSETG
ncbi:MMPL family transporter [Gordonia shandongensis]|uniref:MMPL family transporter n=1 Tax=Gordonia shandongensis TaxID=376351 RepID=UPI0003FC2135|nr:MMPL family transporter [Gordonia shandongensis]